MVMRIYLRPFALALPLTLLAAGVGRAATSQELEQVISSEPTPAGIDVTVATGGCTKKADFEVTSSPAGDGKASVELRRKTPDTCKGNFPDGLKLQYTWGELNLPQGTQLSVKNPVEPAFTDQPVSPPPAVQAAKSARHLWAPRHRRRWHRHRRHRHFHRHRGHCHCAC